MRRPAFSLIEVLLVLGLVSVVGAVGMPMFRSFQTRSDVSLAAEYIRQGMDRAKLLSETGHMDSTWGFRVGSGILFKGASFATRDSAYDETFDIPETVGITGLQEVTFSKLLGSPSATGTVLLTALTGEQVSVSLRVTNSGIPIVQNDEITVCHKPGTPACETKTINESAWNGHNAHGDTLGPCSPEQCEEGEGGGGGGDDDDDDHDDDDDDDE